MTKKQRTTVYANDEDWEKIQENAKDEHRSVNDYLIFSALHGSFIRHILKIVKMLEDLLPFRGGVK